MLGRDHPTAFYIERPDGALVGTEATRGPWSEAHQHGGPPCALLARAVEQYGEAPEQFVVARLTVELLQPIAITTPLRVAVDPVKLGGQAQRFALRLYEASGEATGPATGARTEKVVAVGTALRLRKAAVALSASPRHAPTAPLPAPDACTPFEFPFFSTAIGYHTAVQVRVARGQWGHGACAAWLRPRIPLLDREALSAVQAVAIVADAANGVAAVLDTSRYAFVNPDLTIAMVRPPRGTWVGLDAHGTALPIGTGLNDCVLHDQQGALGRVLQSLVIRPRG